MRKKVNAALTPKSFIAAMGPVSHELLTPVTVNPEPVKPEPMKPASLTNQQMVEAFHKKHGFWIDIDLSNKIPTGDGWIIEDAYSGHLNHIASMVEYHSNNTASGTYANGPLDPRLIRAHLLLEEAGVETLRALAARDKTLLADALADTLYVAYGAAVTYGIPLDEVFAEVHRSNMTKAVRDKDAKDSDPRLRDKGASYQPPDIAGVLEKSSQR